MQARVSVEGSRRSYKLSVRGKGHCVCCDGPFGSVCKGRGVELCAVPKGLSMVVSSRLACEVDVAGSILVGTLPRAVARRVSVLSAIDHGVVDERVADEIFSVSGSRFTTSTLEVRMDAIAVEVFPRGWGPPPWNRGEDYASRPESCEHHPGARTRTR